MRTNHRLFFLLLLLISFSTGAQQTNSISAATNEETTAILRSRAEHGDAQSEMLLGLEYFAGDGVAKNKAEAFKWLLKSAEDGNTNLYSLIGGLYYKDDFLHMVPANHAEAARWYLRAAQLGKVEAQNIIAGMYQDGDGVKQDYAQAAFWFQKAADQGDDASQNNLGVLYQEGRGVPQDFVEAYKWYNLSAAQGDSKAVENRRWLARSMTPSQIAQAQEMSRDFPSRAHSHGHSNTTSSDGPSMIGTGFFITTDGYLVTNFHVIKDARRVRIKTTAGLLPAKVAQTDEANDLALLKVKGHFSALPVAASRSVGLGDTVFTVGFPDPELQGFSPKLAKGEIASLTGMEDSAQYFQISAPLQPGNSGGPLVDGHDNVIGIVAARLDDAAALKVSGALPENVNYAIKSSYLLSFLESLPDVVAKLRAPNQLEEKFPDAVRSTEKATVMVLAY